MTFRKYATALAWKQALEERLRKSTATGLEFARQRQVLVYQRFLARMVAVFGDAVTLKGGMVLQCRSTRARATKDVDVCMAGAPIDLLPKLRASGMADLGDHMTFDVRPHDDHPEIQNEGMKYHGLRFHVTCMLADKIYGRQFGVDVVFGEPMFGPCDTVVAEDLLAFAGIPPPQLVLCPVELHIAEKLHAYTMPRARPNSRVKDLPDMALLGTLRPLDANGLRSVIERSYAYRNTHEMPRRLPDPPASWAIPYADMVQEDQLAWPTLTEVTAAVRAFLDPVLAGGLDAEWMPGEWAWRRRG